MLEGETCTHLLYCGPVKDFVDQFASSSLVSSSKCMRPSCTSVVSNLPQSDIDAYVKILNLKLKKISTIVQNKGITM